ncbi:caspase family protein [Leptolyngbya sp. FACHB-321]|uniref:caspase family protein n=1 Tax=Leptolyngbya sp. FACHB-321 TaxID=2692807 RepID=UPI001682AFDE|nr:caspase family protein [Leptolyngbya sp. FACHB-321]MBD2038587.1 caspase family protein [Leptolyngbya sp. FACHB-321]
MVKVALLVGVSEYEPGLNPLPGAVKDVDAMQRVLADPELGGFAEADITVLKNPQRQEMEDEIYRLFSDRKKDDLLLFYFSGHGIKDENGRLYLATRVTRKDTNGRLVKPSAVATASLHENINESRSQRQVIILDCCFSGAIAQGMTVKNDGTVNLKEYLGGKGRAILTSSTSTEYSFGAATGHDDAGLSIYTRHLVEGMETGAADVDGDGWIAVEELHEYAASRVKEAAPAMTPKFYPVEEGYKIVLSRSRQDDPKLKYRKEVQTSAEAGQGKLLFFAQKVLEGKRAEWNISVEEAQAIEDAVLEPYRQCERKLYEYEQALTEAVQIEYPFSVANETALSKYQQQLGLRDADIAAIAARVLAPLRVEDEQDAEPQRQAKPMQPAQKLSFPGNVTEQQVSVPVLIPGTPEPAVQPPQTITTQPATPKLMPAQKRRLKQRQQALEDERNIRSEKLGHLRKSFAIETGEAVKFQLQKQIQDEEVKLAALDDELDAIDQSLQN